MKIVAGTVCVYESNTMNKKLNNVIMKTISKKQSSTWCKITPTKGSIKKKNYSIYKIYPNQNAGWLNVSTPLAKLQMYKSLPNLKAAELINTPFQLASYDSSNTMPICYLHLNQQNIESATNVTKQNSQFGDHKSKSLINVQLFDTEPLNGYNTHECININNIYNMNQNNSVVIYETKNTPSLNYILNDNMLKNDLQLTNSRITINNLNGENNNSSIYEVHPKPITGNNSETEKSDKNVYLLKSFSSDCLTDVNKENITSIYRGLNFDDPINGWTRFHRRVSFFFSNSSCLHPAVRQMLSKLFANETTTENLNKQIQKANSNSRQQLQINYEPNKMIRGITQHNQTSTPINQSRTLEKTFVKVNDAPKKTCAVNEEKTKLNSYQNASIHYRKTIRYNHNLKTYTQQIRNLSTFNDNSKQIIITYTNFNGNLSNNTSRRICKSSIPHKLAEDYRTILNYFKQSDRDDDIPTLCTSSNKELHTVEGNNRKFEPLQNKPKKLNTDIVVAHLTKFYNDFETKGKETEVIKNDPIQNGKSLVNNSVTKAEANNISQNTCLNKLSKTQSLHRSLRGKSKVNCFHKQPVHNETPKENEVEKIKYMQTLIKSLNKNSIKDELVQSEEIITKNSIKPGRKSKIPVPMKVDCIENDQTIIPMKNYTVPTQQNKQFNMKKYLKSSNIEVGKIKIGNTNTITAIGLDGYNETPSFVDETSSQPARTKKRHEELIPVKNTMKQNMFGNRLPNEEMGVNINTEQLPVQPVVSNSSQQFHSKYLSNLKGKQKNKFSQPQHRFRAKSLTNKLENADHKKLNNDENNTNINNDLEDKTTKTPPISKKESITTSDKQLTQENADNTSENNNNELPKTLTQIEASKTNSNMDVTKCNYSKPNLTNKPSKCLSDVNCRLKNKYLHSQRKFHAKTVHKSLENGIYRKVNNAKRNSLENKQSTTAITSTKDNIIAINENPTQSSSTLKNNNKVLQTNSNSNTVNVTKFNPPKSEEPKFSNLISSDNKQKRDINKVLSQLSTEIKQILYSRQSCNTSSTKKQVNSNNELNETSDNKITSKISLVSGKNQTPRIKNNKSTFSKSPAVTPENKLNSDIKFRELKKKNFDWANAKISNKPVKDFVLYSGQASDRVPDLRQYYSKKGINLVNSKNMKKMHDWKKSFISSTRNNQGKDSKTNLEPESNDVLDKHKPQDYSQAKETQLKCNEYMEKKQDWTKWAIPSTRNDKKVDAMSNAELQSTDEHDTGRIHIKMGTKKYDSKSRMYIKKKNWSNSISPSTLDNEGTDFVSNAGPQLAEETATRQVFKVVSNDSRARTNRKTKSSWESFVIPSLRNDQELDSLSTAESQSTKEPETRQVHLQTSTDSKSRGNVSKTDARDSTIPSTHGNQQTEVMPNTEIQSIERPDTHQVYTQFVSNDSRSRGHMEKRHNAENWVIPPALNDEDNMPYAKTQPPPPKVSDTRQVYTQKITKDDLNRGHLTKKDSLNSITSMRNQDTHFMSTERSQSNEEPQQVYSQFGSNDDRRSKSYMKQKHDWKNWVIPPKRNDKKIDLSTNMESQLTEDKFQVYSHNVIQDDAYTKGYIKKKDWTNSITTVRNNQETDTMSTPITNEEPDKRHISEVVAKENSKSKRKHTKNKNDWTNSITPVRNDQEKFFITNESPVIKNSGYDYRTKLIEQYKQRGKDRDSNKMKHTATTSDIQLYSMKNFQKSRDPVANTNQYNNYKTFDSQKRKNVYESVPTVVNKSRVRKNPSKLKEFLDMDDENEALSIVNTKLGIKTKPESNTTIKIRPNLRGLRMRKLKEGTETDETSKYVRTLEQTVHVKNKYKNNKEIDRYCIYKNALYKKTKQLNKLQMLQMHTMNNVKENQSLPTMENQDENAPKENMYRMQNNMIVNVNSIGNLETRVMAKRAIVTKKSSKGFNKNTGLGNQEKPSVSSDETVHSKDYISRNKPTNENSDNIDDNKKRTQYHIPYLIQPRITYKHLQKKLQAQEMNTSLKDDGKMDNFDRINIYNQYLRPDVHSKFIKPEMNTEKTDNSKAFGGLSLREKISNNMFNLYNTYKSYKPENKQTGY